MAGPVQDSAPLADWTTPFSWVDAETEEFIHLLFTLSAVPHSRAPVYERDFGEMQRVFGTYEARDYSRWYRLSQKDVMRLTDELAALGAFDASKFAPCFIPPLRQVELFLERMATGASMHRTAEPHCSESYIHKLEERLLPFFVSELRTSSSMHLCKKVNSSLSVQSIRVRFAAGSSPSR